MSIREVNAVAITDAVEELCIRANTQLPPDVKQALDNAHAAEPWPLARQTLELLQQNLCVAAEKDLPICQDTGMACVFIELGQDVHINGNLDEAVNEGVRRGYEKAYLRKSITADPLQRVNTGDNTPAFLTVHLVPGDVCKITVAPKGAGSENMSRLTMLKPADGVQGVKDFVMETVKQAGANPCPPIVLGIGIGGSFDKCAALAKKALLRPLDQPNADYAVLPYIVQSFCFLLFKEGTTMPVKSPYTSALARRVTWQLTLTATGRQATWVGSCSMQTPRQVVAPPKPCGPKPVALMASNSSFSSAA